MKRGLRILLLVIAVISISCGRDDKEINALIEETEQDAKSIVPVEAQDSVVSDVSDVTDDKTCDDESEKSQSDGSSDANDEQMNDEDNDGGSETDDASPTDDDLENKNDTIAENSTSAPDGDHLEEDVDDGKTSFSIERFASNSKYHQSAASYGDYAFLVTDRHTHFYMYNLKTKSLIYDLTYPSGTGKDFLGQTLYHCNQSTFGSQIYEDGDPFPLLYISQHAKADKRYFVEAYRILPVWDDEKGEYTSFEVELVQTIYFPSMTNENALGNINMAIDTETNEMYTYSRNNNSGQDNSGKCMISCFDLPDVHESEVYLNDSDIKSSFYLGCTAVYMQGGCIHDRTLYIAQGAKSVGYIYLNIVDLNSQQLETRLNLLNAGFTWEPEGCFIFDEDILLGANTYLYKMSNNK